MLSSNMTSAFLLLGQGMAGIFTVLGIIALIVLLLGRFDQNRQHK